MTRLRCRQAASLRAAAAVLLGLGLAVDTDAQTVKAVELKAAFLVNFSKFTE